MWKREKNQTKKELKFFVKILQSKIQKASQF